jgi:hypothetical protein
MELNYVVASINHYLLSVYWGLLFSSNRLAESLSSLWSFLSICFSSYTFMLFWLSYWGSVAIELFSSSASLWFYIYWSGGLFSRYLFLTGVVFLLLLADFGPASSYSLWSSWSSLFLFSTLLNIASISSLL